MTIYELKEIISLMDFDKICAELEARGFRREMLEWVTEFKHDDIINNCSRIEETEAQDDGGTTKYKCTLYTGADKFDGLTFIRASIIPWNPECGFFPPRKSILFTDAPPNEAFLTDMNSDVKCDRCGNEFVKKHLFEYGEELICADCLTADLENNYESTMRNILKSQ